MLQIGIMRLAYQLLYDIFFICIENFVWNSKNGVVKIKSKTVFILHKVLNTKYEHKILSH